MQKLLNWDGSSKAWSQTMSKWTRSQDSVAWWLLSYWVGRSLHWSHFFGFRLHPSSYPVSHRCVPCGGNLGAFHADWSNYSTLRILETVWGHQGNEGKTMEDSGKMLNKVKCSRTLKFNKDPWNHKPNMDDSNMDRPHGIQGKSLGNPKKTMPILGEKHDLSLRHKFRTYTYSWTEWMMNDLMFHMICQSARIVSIRWLRLLRSFFVILRPLPSPFTPKPKQREQSANRLC